MWTKAQRPTKPAIASSASDAWRPQPNNSAISWLPCLRARKGGKVTDQVLRQPAIPSNGAVEHPTECDPIDRARMDAEANDPSRVLIHDDQDPVGPQRGRLAPEQIHTPEAFFMWPRKVSQEGPPEGCSGR